MEIFMSNKSKNDIYFLIEIIIFSCFLVTFLILNFVKIQDNVANIVYISYTILSFGWFFLSSLCIKDYNNTAHKKMFKKYYVAQNTNKPLSIKRNGIWKVIILWIIYLMAIFTVKYLGILTWQLFLAGMSAMFILNSIFTRKICLLSLLFLHNKNNCCKNCGINAWDYSIFASSLIFAPYLSLFATILNITIISISLILLIVWEVLYHKYPERFYQEYNANLSCKGCDKRCYLKK